MEQLNLRHLYYFWVISREGSIARASEVLELAPQTLSGQLATFEASVGGESFLTPICLHFGSMWAPFGTLGPPKVRFFAFWHAPARTFAHSARRYDFEWIWVPRGGPKACRR